MAEQEQEARMRGLLLKLMDDERDAAGRSFWRCFEPLRTEFDRYCWISAFSPFMVYPAALSEESLEYEGEGDTSVVLWRKGFIGRWAEHSGEEFVDVWAVAEEIDPTRAAADFACERYDVIKRHAALRLLYTDSTCWEIYARDEALLERVRVHLKGAAVVEVYESRSGDRKGTFLKAGLGWQDNC